VTPTNDNILIVAMVLAVLAALTLAAVATTVTRLAERMWQRSNILTAQLDQARASADHWAARARKAERELLKLRDEAHWRDSYAALPPQQLDQTGELRMRPVPEPRDQDESDDERRSWKDA